MYTDSNQINKYQIIFIPKHLILIQIIQQSQKNKAQKNKSIQQQYIKHNNTNITIVKMIKHFLKLTSLSNKILTSQCIYKVHHMGQNTPKQYNHKWQAWQKKILYDKQYKIIAQEDANYYDQLLLPGYDQSNISDLVLQFRARKVKLAPTTLCMLIHSFIKFNVMGGQIFDQIQKQAFRLKGQYKIRSIFGALRGSIQYNRINLVNFFLDEYKATDKKFTMEQMLQLLSTINQSKFWTIQQKIKFWGDNFQRDFSDGILNIKIRPVQLLARVFDNLVQIQNKDQAVTLKLIQYMKNRKGWDQIPVFERLYSISDKYEQAQKLFDKYFQKMSQDQTILSRYNLTQLRYLTPLEIIKYVEQNPSDYYPKFRTIVPEQQNADVWNQKYEQYLKVGAVKEEQQIIRDKSKSLGFAIKQRYETLRADNIDFTKMKPEQFQEMFGSFDQAMETIKVEDAKADQKKRMQQQLLNQQAQQLNEQQQQLIGKKGKGKGKQKKQGKKQKKAQAKQ